ncbi:MAG TPA: hypothetical protein VHI11_06480 [Jiangellaceae bacterium]|nr:hypothetical protein [Jiangellaceae bacterium]
MLRRHWPSSSGKRLPERAVRAAAAAVFALFGVWLLVGALS